MTARYFITLLLVTIARALLAHCCAELIRRVVACIAPNLPPLVALGVGLVIAVVLIEVVAAFCHHRTTRRE